MKKLRSILPGFRTEITWKKVIAILGYIIMSFLILTIIYSSNDSEISKNNIDILINYIDGTFTAILIVILPFIILTNFAGINKKLPFLKSPKKFVRVASISLYLLIIFVIWATGLSALTGYHTKDYKIADEKKQELRKIAEKKAIEENKSVAMLSERKAESKKKEEEAEKKAEEKKKTEVAKKKAEAKKKAAAAKKTEEAKKKAAAAKKKAEAKKKLAAAKKKAEAKKKEAAAKKKEEAKNKAAAAKKKAEEKKKVAAAEKKAESKKKAAEAKKLAEEKKLAEAAKMKVEQMKNDDDNFNKGINEMDNGGLELAINYFKKISKNYKDYDEVQRYINTAQRDLFVEQCNDIPYNQLKKNADNYSGQKVHFYGKIYNIQENEGKTLISLSTKITLGDYIGDEVFILFPKSIDNVEGDFIDIYGEVVGKYSSKSDIIGKYLDISFGKKYSVYYTRLTALDLAPIIETRVITDANGRIY